MSGPVVLKSITFMGAMPMGNRFLLFTRAGVIALMITLDSTAAPADCLSAPNQTPAAGEHWYYRTSRETDQKCWYLRGRDPATADAKPTLKGTQADTDVSAHSKAKTLSTSEKQELFEAFLRWKKQRETQ
jgi:hypothetical protein